MNANHQPAHSAELTVRIDQPLIGLPRAEHGAPTVVYFTDEDAAEQTIGEDAVEDALALAGAWQDVAWEDIAAGLDELRHANPPTPPLRL